MYNQYSQERNRIQDAFIDGRACKKFTVMKGDNGDAVGNTIAGIDDLYRLYEGRRSQWLFGVYIPSGQVITPDNPYKIAGVHSEAFPDKQLDFHIYGNTVKATVKWDENGIVQPAFHANAPVLYDEWMDFEVSYFMSKDIDGNWQWRINGTKYMHWNGKTLFSADDTSEPGRGPYCQYCVYDNHMPENVDSRTVFINTQPVRWTING